MLAEKSDGAIDSQFMVCGHMMSHPDSKLLVYSDEM